MWSSHVHTLKLHMATFLGLPAGCETCTCIPVHTCRIFSWTNKDTQQLLKRYKNPAIKANDSPAKGLVSFSFTAQIQSASPHNSNNMHFRAPVLLLSAVAPSFLVAAAPEPVARDGTSCSNGELKCCNKIYEVSCFLLFCFATRPLTTILFLP